MAQSKKVVLIIKKNQCQFYTKKFLETLYTETFYLELFARSSISVLVTTVFTLAAALMQSEGLSLMVWQNCPWHTHTDNR